MSWLKNGLKKKKNVRFVCYTAACRRCRLHEIRSRARVIRELSSLSTAFSPSLSLSLRPLSPRNRFGVRNNTRSKVSRESCPVRSHTRPPDGRQTLLGAFRFHSSTFRARHQKNRCSARRLSARAGVYASLSAADVYRSCAAPTLLHVESNMQCSGAPLYECMIRRVISENG